VSNYILRQNDMAGYDFWAYDWVILIFHHPSPVFLHTGKIILSLDCYKLSIKDILSFSNPVRENGSKKARM